MKICKKCKGTGNYFKKLYDTAIGNPNGVWTRCSCLNINKQRE